jgi:threonine/homoserine/homoserine lactone efflux protein
VLIGLLALSIFGEGSGSGGRSSAIGDTIDAVLGVVFLVFALKSLLNMPDPNAPPPKWMSSLSSMGPSRAFVFGMLVMATNFTTLALFVSGVKEIVLTEVGVLGSAVAFVLLTSIVLSELLVPIVLYAIEPSLMGNILSSVREWLEKNNRIIMLIFFGVFGVLLVTKGLLGLLSEGG